MKVYQLIFILLICSVLLGQSTDTSITRVPEISPIDRIRISEAFNISEKIGDSLWYNWSKAPFAVLLVTEEFEFLINHPNPSAEFKMNCYDSLLQSYIYYRPRKFGTNLLATFPAVNSLSTVVIGQAENTESNNSTRWVMTLLHEHFHQLQNFQPDYYTSVNSLNLSGGDKTGMWMLNYPFPYDSAKVIDAFSKLSNKLFDAVKSVDQDNFKIKSVGYLKERKKFKEEITPEDYKYFSFQIWQEGIARYTEYALAKIATNNYETTAEFKNLDDYYSLKSFADSNYEKILFTLPDIKLNEFRRIAFYYFGAVEAILLDKINPNWKKQYFENKFYLEEYYKM